MTDINKFLADIQKSVKIGRQKNGGKSDYNLLRDDLLTLFSRNASDVGELANSVFEHWENAHVRCSQDLAYEPSEDNQRLLAAYLAFLQSGDEYQDLISADDWAEFARLVNFEAEELDVGILQDLMGILVSKGAY